MKDLNDLIYVAAVTQTGSLAAAARKLHVNHATVFRRIAQIEKDLGVRLFERGSGRYVATPAGEELAAAGAAIERTAEHSLLKVAGRDLRPSGVVRITTTDSIATGLLNPVLALCRIRYPQIALHIVIDNAMLDLAKRDADIAVRPTRLPPDYLVGKRIAPLAFALYGAVHYLNNTTACALSEHQWIALGDSQERHRSLLWLQKIIPLNQVGYRIDGFSNIARACAEGLGLAVLPCFLGDSLAPLRRIQDPLPDLASELWVLTHPDLRNTTRIQTVFQFLYHELGKWSLALQGIKP
ncbi:MAG: LysR family transcriptional regulator [Pseudomonadota bacterium]